jgi:hypothetical protein
VPGDADAHSAFELNNAEIETALQTGEHAGLLEDYFGPEAYLELTRLAREAASRRVRGGPAVWIVPGLMGTKLGRRRTIRLFDDVVWFDPIDVALGKLDDLILPAGKKLRTLGVMLIAYLKLKLRAIQTARRAVRENNSRDWADYIFYGSHDFVLKEVQREVEGGTES